MLGVRNAGEGGLPRLGASRLPRRNKDSKPQRFYRLTGPMRLDQENNFLFTDRPTSGTNPSGNTARALAPNRMQSMFLTNGGSMHRYITAFIVLLALAFAGEAHAQF